MNDRDLGELIGTVRGMADRLSSLEIATREGFRQTQDRVDTQSAKADEQAKEWHARIGALERWKYWIMGGLATLSLLYAVGLVILAQRL